MLHWRPLILLVSYQFQPFVSVSEFFLTHQADQFRLRRRHHPDLVRRRAWQGQRSPADDHGSDRSGRLWSQRVDRLRYPQGDALFLWDHSLRYHSSMSWAPMSSILQCRVRINCDRISWKYPGKISQTRSSLWRYPGGNIIRIFSTPSDVPFPLDGNIFRITLDFDQVILNNRALGLNVSGPKAHFNPRWFQVLCKFLLHYFSLVLNIWCTFSNYVNFFYLYIFFHFRYGILCITEFNKRLKIKEDESDLLKKLRI